MTFFRKFQTMISQKEIIHPDISGSLRHGARSLPTLTLCLDSARTPTLREDLASLSILKMLLFVAISGA